MAFLKRLWTSTPTVCPKCNKAELITLHKKAKKSDCDWKCAECGEIYRTIVMFQNLPEKKWTLSRDNSRHSVKASRVKHLRCSLFNS